jgi:5-methylcytosine-specific restriction enzyme A
MDLQTIIQLIKEDKLVKFYQSKAWRGLRLKALQRDNYECQVCKRRGKVSPAQNVHHIKEVKQYPELALVLDNLESICIPCHNEEHDRLKDYQKPKQKFWNDERW